MKKRGKRTIWDFSKYEHRVEIFKSESGKEIRVDHLQRENSRIGYIKFINDSEGMSVYGDFGNWIFCTPFIPEPKDYVCDMYWNEKLKISSCQDHSKFDCKETEKELEEWINHGLEDHGFEGEELEQSKEWFRHLLTLTYDELEYTHEAYRGDRPECLDYEDIPFCKKGSVQLEVIFDAFEEICSRL